MRAPSTAGPRVDARHEAHMNDDDFDNDMGLPEDELTGGSAMADSGDLGLGLDAEDEMDTAAPSRPSGGARARSVSAPRSAKPAASRKSAAGKSGGARKAAASKGRRKAAKTSRKAARKTARAGARKGARKGAKKAARGRKKGGRRR